MNVEATMQTSQERVSNGLLQASELQDDGKLVEAVAELERTLEQARATPYEIEFQTRIQVAMSLADLHQTLGEIAKAQAMLADELAFVEKVSQIMQATGTPSQKRAATGGFLQVRDRTTQMSLIGQPAPELSVKEWINGQPALLEDLKGRVVLLEFWATWCKPCQEMFPKLQELYENEAASGLEIVAITRHYMAYGGTAETMAEELQLMRRMVSDNAVTFSVAVAENERLQTIYGANGLPTVALIDRQSAVQYAGAGLEDPLFKAALQRCLAESS
ncbi:MAG TPA: TlpA disulfide reductase family protein [Pyrinomonadaceae bacterium]|nr:TlpA disulfide reductase family protein [Pyrinomonadaceae bacterium]